MFLNALGVGIGQLRFWGTLWTEFVELNGQAIAEHPLARISIDPLKRSGQPCIRDLRITTRDVLEYLAGGMTEAEILQEFPDLEHEDFLAVYAWAADSAGVPHK